MAKSLKEFKQLAESLKNIQGPHVTVGDVTMAFEVDKRFNVSGFTLFRSGKKVDETDVPEKTFKELNDAAAKHIKDKYSRRMNESAEEISEVFRDGSSEINNKLHIVHQRVMDQLEHITEVADSYRLIKHPNYGHVGNLEKIEHDLDNVARFLGKSMKESVEVGSETEQLDEAADALRKWVINKLENTEEPHDQILAEFKKKFGADKIAQFDKIVSEIVD